MRRLGTSPEGEAGAASGSSGDTEELRDELLRMRGEAEALGMSLELHRATGAASAVGGGGGEGGDDGFFQESLRDLSRRVEDVAGDVQQSGAPELTALLADVQAQLARSAQPDAPSGGGDGATDGKDPAGAFAAAASGGASEIPYRAEMEARFGADFSSVQSFAGRGLEDLGALAATRGEQVVFAAATPDRQTVAHELTHVLQSRQGLASGKAMSDPGDASEREARGVAASLDGPSAAGKSVSVSAAPSGAIHRQDPETRPAPHPSHLDNTMGQARPINWDAASGTMLTEPEMPPDFGGAESAREIYNFYLLRNLRLELPGEVARYVAEGAGPELPPETLNADEGRAPRAAAVDALLAFLKGRMASLLVEPTTKEGLAAAQAIRVPLFRASQQAVVTTLNVEQSPRYDQTRDPADSTKITATFCNVFAYDMVTAMGAYIPRVWWRDPAVALADPTYDANPDNTFQLSANALYQWMLEWGPSFGWRSVETPAAAQGEANLGKIVIVLAGLGNPKPADPGHVSVVMAESNALGREGRGDGIPLQAQAGEVNFSNSSVLTADQDGRYDNATGPWWETFPKKDLPALEPNQTRHADMSAWAEYASGYGFFVYDGAGRGEVSIRAPEETGLVLPAPAAPAASGTSS